MGWPSTRVCVLLETRFQFILAPGAPPLPPLGHQDLARVRVSRSTASASSAATRTLANMPGHADDDARFHDRQQAYVHARGDGSDPPKTRIDYSWVQEERERLGGARRN